MGSQDEKGQNTSEIAAVISAKGFSELSENVQMEALNSAKPDKKQDGGWMGKLFGNNKENQAINVVFVICALLLLLCFVDAICSLIQGRGAYTELMGNIIPIISLAIGYLLGKGKPE